MDIKKNHRSWDTYSSEYYSMSEFDDSLVHLGLGLPGIEASMFVGAHMKILDVGCGDGTNTMLMAWETDGSVVGIDVASDAINLAKDKVIRKDVSFECRDFFSFVDNNNGCFDLITFIGSIDYMELNDFFFQGLNKITTSKSRCLVSKFHPFWTTLYANDVDSEQMYTYFDNGRRDAVSYGTSPSNEFERFHYTIGYLIESFKNYGWSICKFLEPRPDFSNSAFTYRGYTSDEIMISRLSRIPMTLVLELVRE